MISHPGMLLEREKTNKKNKWSLNCEDETFITSRLAHKFNLNNYIPQNVLNKLDGMIDTVTN